MNHSKCRTLFEAGAALLRKSGLVHWSGQTLAFVPTYPGTDDSEFEKYLKAEFHPKLGRYMAWVLFSVGAENLATIKTDNKRGSWLGADLLLGKPGGTRVFRLSDNPCPKLFRQGRRRLQSNVETRETEARVYGEEDNRMTLQSSKVGSEKMHRQMGQPSWPNRYCLRHSEGTFAWNASPVSSTGIVSPRWWRTSTRVVRVVRATHR